jgi:TRAP-type mannitol/chloroaromatic compound transport system substrate-binding protein
MKKTMFLISIAVMVSLIIPPATSAQKPIVWVGQAVNDPGSPFMKIFEQMCADITKASNGRLVLKPNAVGTIVPFGKEWDALRAKTLDFANSNTMWYSERSPSAALFTYMVGGLSPMEFYLWLEVGGGAALLKKAMKGSNAHIIPGSGILPTPETFMYSKKPINKVEDLKGIKMRTAGDGGLVLSKLGVNTVGIPYPEIYDSMKKGVIDAFEAAPPSYDVTQGMHEVAPYIYLSGARQPMEWIPIAVRQDLWNELPEDLKIIVTKISKEAAIRSYAESVKEDNAAIEIFRKFGCKVSILNPEIEAAVEKAAEEVYAEKSAKDATTAEVVKSLIKWKKRIRAAYPRL